MSDVLGAPDGPYWAAPRWMGYTARFTDQQLRTRAQWGQDASLARPGSHHPGYPGFAAWSTNVVIPTPGGNELTFVNALDPASTGWLEPPGDVGRVVPAGRR